MDVNNITVNNEPVDNNAGTIKTKVLKSTDKISHGKIYPFNNRDFYFLIFAALSTFLCVRLGFLNGLNVGFTITYSVLCIGALFYVHTKKAINKLLNYLVLIVNLVLIASFTLHDNDGIKFLTVLVVLFITFMILNSLNGTSLCNDGSFLKIVDIFYVGIIEPLINFWKFAVSLKTVFKNRSNKFVMVIPGILISIPVLIVVIPLLSSADAAFNTIVQKVFSNVALLILSLVLTVLILPFLSAYCFSLAGGITNDKNKSINSKPGRVSVIFLNTFLLIIGFIYLVFLVSQLAYISDTFAFLLPEEFSAAEFARSGFFQMCAIAFINLLITFIVSVIEKPKDNGKLPVSTKLILTFFTAFSLFLAVNSFIRMSMYIEMYGLTRLRVLTSVFMIMLCIIFLIILVRIFNEKFKYINFVIFTCAVTFMLVSVSGIDCLISKYNYEKYISGKIELDFEHFEELGNAAVPELIEVAENDKNYVTRFLARDTLADILYNEYDYYDIRYYNHKDETAEPFVYKKNIFAYNILENAAGKALERHFSDVLKNGAEISEIDDSFYEYESIVNTYGADKFFPDFSNSFDNIYNAEFEYGSCNYKEKALKTAELNIVYDTFTYKETLSFINKNYEFIDEFETPNCKVKVVKNDDDKNSVGVIVFREDYDSVIYLWATNDEPLIYLYNRELIKDVFEVNLS